jgi:hypothetical protein
MAADHHSTEALAAAGTGRIAVPKWWQRVRPVEAIARAINAEPWEPLPGMVKRECPRCRYFFATLLEAEEPLCPDCTIRHTLAVEPPGETQAKRAC